MVTAPGPAEVQTPVPVMSMGLATYARGGLTEFIDERVGALAPPDDVVSLAKAVSRARSRDRSEARRRAAAVCSLETTVSAYEQHYARVLHG